MHKRNQRRLTKALSAFMAAALVFTSFPSEAKAGKKKEVTQIQITSPYSAKDKKVTTTLTMKKGSTFKIKASVFPKSASKKLVYKSNKSKVASVSKSGKISAKKVGKAKITVQPKGNKKVKAVINVTVVNKLAKVKKIALDKSSLSLSVNSTAQLNASVVSPKKPTSKKFNWFTSNADVAVVNKKGTVTAKAVGSADIMATSADGQGAKAVCKVTVTEDTVTVPSTVPSAAPSAVPSAAPSGAPGTNPSNAPASQTPGVEPSSSPVTPSASPSASPADPSASPSSAPVEQLAVVVTGSRTGIKQGESIQLTASGPGSDQVTWSVSGASGVTISGTGLLTAAADAAAGKKIQVKAETSADVSVKSASASLTVMENKIQPVTEGQIQLNEDTAEHPLGLTYRSKNAWSIVSDPQRGDVVRIDTSVDYVNDMLAWLEVDPAYAGKTVSISAYVKYDKLPNRDTIGIVLNERWGFSNPAAKWSADPDTWYHLTGTYKLPEGEYRYDGTKNFIFLSRFHELSSGENAVYYIDGLVITAEKSQVEGVTVTTKGDKTELYQNNTLQCSAKVSGKNSPSQKVTYSIDPAVEGASIDEKGLLTVGNAAAGSEITVKATSVEDPSKFGTATVTVLEQTIDSITVTAKGRVTKIFADDKLQFSAKASTTGDLETKIEWSVERTDTTGTASISEEGLLTVSGLEAGTTINVVAKAVSVTDPSKQAEAKYELTILGDYVEPHVIKATEANQWDEITDSYYYNLTFDETEESAYFENAPSGTTLAGGDNKSKVGFKINSDGSLFDASAYNAVKVHLKSDASGNSTNARGARVYFYSESGSSLASYNIPYASESTPTGTPLERVWTIPLKNCMNSDKLSLTDMKALTIESAYATAGLGLKVYSFTFERISPYAPTTLKIIKPKAGEVLTPTKPKIKYGRPLSLKTTATNIDGEEIDNINLNWTSSDDKIATVSEDGVVTGVAAGNVTITASIVGFEDVTASYNLTIYDDTPCSIKIRVGAISFTSSSAYYTRDELSPANEGLEVKAVLQDEGGEIVGEATPDEITFSNASTTTDTRTAITPQASNGKLTATVDENGTANASSFKVNIKLNDFSASKTIMVYNGYRLLTADTVYNASSGKENSDITFDRGFATIEGFDGGCNAIGFKGTLPNGKTLNNYNSVHVVYEKTNNDYPMSLYMPTNGWDTNFITCGTDNAKLASNDTKKTDSIVASSSEFTLSLSEEEKNTNNFHFAVGFGENCMGNLTLQSIILIE